MFSSAKRVGFISDAEKRLKSSPAFALSFYFFKMPSESAKSARICSKVSFAVWTSVAVLPGLPSLGSLYMLTASPQRVSRSLAQSRDNWPVWKSRPKCRPNLMYSKQSTQAVKATDMLTAPAITPKGSVIVKLQKENDVGIYKVVSRA